MRLFAAASCPYAHAAASLPCVVKTNPDLDATAKAMQARFGPKVLQHSA